MNMDSVLNCLYHHLFQQVVCQQKVGYNYLAHRVRHCEEYQHFYQWFIGNKLCIIYLLKWLNYFLWIFTLQKQKDQNCLCLFLKCNLFNTKFYCFMLYMFAISEINLSIYLPGFRKTRRDVLKPIISVIKMGCFCFPPLFINLFIYLSYQHVRND